MRPLGDKSYANLPSRTRSGKNYGRVLQSPGDAKQKNGADLMPQDRTFSVGPLMSADEIQTQVETLEGGTQVLDEFTDRFSSELVEAVCDTQVLEDSKDECQDRRGGLEYEPRVSDEHEDNSGIGLKDMEGDTQILDDAEDASPDQLANFGTHAEINENACTKILNDHRERLCTEGLVSISDGGISVRNNGRRSSREMCNCKISSDCLTDSTMDHTSGTSVAHTSYNCDQNSGYVPPRFTEIRIESLLASGVAARSRQENKNFELNCSTSTTTSQYDYKNTDKSGYVPLRFTEIRVESLIASGLAAKERALSGKTAGAFCSVRTSPAKQKHIDKENDNLVKGSPSNTEGTDDEDYSAFSEPKDRYFGKGGKLKSSAVRKLFTDELVPQTEACGIILTGDTESELPAGEGDIDAAGLSYIDSQEPNDLAHTKALEFVEKFLTANLVDIDTNYLGSSHVKIKNAVSQSNCKQSLVKKSILRSTVGISKAFDWDDDNEDEGGGAFFCKLREKSSKKENHFLKSAPPVKKSDSFDSEQLENESEEPKANGKKRKLSYSDTRLVSLNLKMTVKNCKENTKQNVLNTWNREPSKSNNASLQNTPDMPIACEVASAGTSVVMKSHVGCDTNQLVSINEGASEGISIGQTRRGSYIKELNLRKRARPGSVKVSEKSVQSIQLMENLACAERKTRSGNGNTPTLVTSNGDSSRVDSGYVREAEQIKPTHSKAKACCRPVGDQAHLTFGNKDAIPRRSCRLNKVTKLEDSSKQQGSAGCTLEQCALMEDVEVMHLPLQACASPDGLTSEYSLKRLTMRSTSSKKQKNMKRTFASCEMASGKSEQHIINNGTTEDLKINGSKSRLEHEIQKSYGNLKNQGKNLETITCTQETRMASLQDSLNPDEIVHDEFFEPIEQSDTYCAKRARTTSTIGHDPVEMKSKGSFFKVIQDPLCRVQLEHQAQFELTSSIKIVGDPMDLSGIWKGIPVRRSCRLNGSSRLDDLSPNVKKQASAGATDEQHSHTDFKTSVKDTTLKLGTSPRQSASTPSMESVRLTKSAKPSEEASPICMGNEYYKISCNQNLPRPDPNKESNNLVTIPPKVMAGLKDSKKRRVMTDVRVLFSRHLDEDTLKHQRKVLVRLGASIASSISDASHFIADKFVRTRNMLEAIALGKPVVTPLWLVSCCEARFHIDEKSYILRDKKKEKEIGFSMSVSLDLARRQPLLQNRRIFITPNTKPGIEVIACLVRAVCGQVIGRIASSSLRNNKIGDGILILTCEEDFAICKPFLEKGAKVYSSEVLLNGIVTQRLEFESYCLFDDCIKRTRSTQRLNKDGKQFLQANRRGK